MQYLNIEIPSIKIPNKMSGASAKEAPVIPEEPMLERSIASGRVDNDLEEGSNDSLFNLYLVISTYLLFITLICMNMMMMIYTGLTKNVQSLMETREEFFSRILVDGEQVIAEFNCSFPSHFVPVWQMVLYTLVTLGLYLFLLAYRAIRRCCYRYRLCTPPTISFQNGKVCFII